MGFLVDGSLKEVKIAVLLRLPGELESLVDTMYVLQETPELLRFLSLSAYVSTLKL
jgi:hypothetical protein